MKRLVYSFCIVFILFISCNREPEKLKVACIGASNTRGFQLPNLDENCYPGQLQKLAGDGWIVFNGGAGGTTVMKEGDLSYWQTLSIRQAQEWEPDIVILDFGWNDMKPVNRKIMERDFVKDYTAMIELFADLPSKPKMFMTLPPLFYTEAVEEHFNYLMKFYKQIIEENDITPIDLYTPMVHERRYYIGDRVHYSVEGCSVAAQVVYDVIMKNLE